MIRVFLLVVSIMSLGVFTFNHTVVPTPIPEVPSEVVVDTNFNTDILHIEFCGDTLPLHQSLVAKRYQKAIQFYDHPSFSRSRKRMQKQARQIEPILKKYGIPADFKYLPFIESGMSANAASPKGALGYWQLMPATAQGLGLVVNDTIDERRDLVKSTRAAAKYLKWLYQELGDWSLVAAAYNAGPNKIIQRMDRQNKDDYFSLRLNHETTQYVYRLVAVKEWASKPERCSEWAKTETVARIAKFVKQQKEALEAQSVAMLTEK